MAYVLPHITNFQIPVPNFRGVIVLSFNNETPNADHQIEFLNTKMQGQPAQPNVTSEDQGNLYGRHRESVC
jgi:hypothetical protein